VISNFSPPGDQEGFSRIAASSLSVNHVNLPPFGLSKTISVIGFTYLLPSRVEVKAINPPPPTGICVGVGVGSGVAVNVGVAVLVGACAIVGEGVFDAGINVGDEGGVSVISACDIPPLQPFPTKRTISRNKKMD
jgi:hypothetical protein